MDITWVLILIVICLIGVSAGCGALVAVYYKEREVRHWKWKHMHDIDMLKTTHKHVVKNFEHFEREWEAAIVSAPVKHYGPGDIADANTIAWRTKPVVERAFKNAKNPQHQSA